MNDLTPWVLCHRRSEWIVRSYRRVGQDRESLERRKGVNGRKGVRNASGEVKVAKLWRMPRPKALDEEEWIYHA